MRSAMGKMLKSRIKEYIAGKESGRRGEGRGIRGGEADK